MDLSELQLGSFAEVVEVRAEQKSAGQLDLDGDPISRRLMELGFIPGTKVQAMHKAPMFGTPLSYLVRGTHVALRIEEAKRIQIIQK